MAATQNLNAIEINEFKPGKNIKTHEVSDISYDNIIFKLNKLHDKRFVNRLREIQASSQQVFLGQYEHGQHLRHIEEILNSFAASLYAAGHYREAADVRQLADIYDKEASEFFQGGGARRTKKLRGRRRSRRALSKRRRTLRRK